MSGETKHWLCLACNQVMEIDSETAAYGCPQCGDDGIPADYDVRPEFCVTWHELRCLVMWAEFYASGFSEKDGGRMQRIVYGIADRLHVQHMDGPPLTFSQELADLRALPGVTELTQNVIREEFGEKPEEPIT